MLEGRAEEGVVHLHHRLIGAGGGAGVGVLDVHHDHRRVGGCFRPSNTEMLRHFHNSFKPAAQKFQGFVDLKMLKLRTAYQGSVPAGINYRFQLTYESEELRQKWIKSDVHQKVWPPIENMLTNKATYPVLLFESV
jgi:hypothetical protein